MSILATESEGVTWIHPLFIETVKSEAASEVNSVCPVSIWGEWYTDGRHLIRTYCALGTVQSSVDGDEQGPAAGTVASKVVWPLLSCVLLVRVFILFFN